MTDDEPIEMEKGPVDDALMRRILMQWYRSSRSGFMRALEWVTTGGFAASAVWFMYLRFSLFTWISLAGLILSSLVIHGYVPLLARVALGNLKKAPSYGKIKRYRFTADSFSFQYGDLPPVEGPLSAFEEARLTRDALLFLGNGRLALWLPRAGMGEETLGGLLSRLRACGVRVTGARAVRAGRQPKNAREAGGGSSGKGASEER